MTNVHPDFLAQLKNLLPAVEVEQFLDACYRPLKKSMTINISKLDVETFKELIKDRWRHLTPSSFTKDPISFYIDRDIRPLALGKTFLHQCGFFYIQEIAASLPATQLDLKPWDIILDMAAAPGGKASQISHMLLKKYDEDKVGSKKVSDGPWLVVANDVNAQRVKSLAHNLNKWWCYNTALTSFNGFTFGTQLPNFFDHVLLDAPCSGEGTAYKSDVAMKYRNIAEINKIAWTQFQLLVSAIKATKPRGTIIYSTCTINPYENENIISKALDFFAGTVELVGLDFVNVNEVHELTESLESNSKQKFDPEKAARLWPHLHQTGGFFVAKLRKLKATNEPAEKSTKLSPKNQFKVDLSKSLQTKVQNRLKEDFGINIDPEKYMFMASKDKLYLVSPTVKAISTSLHFEKMWIPVAKIDKDIFRPTHHLGNILGSWATRNVIILDDEQMQAYTNTDSLPLETLTPHKSKGDTPYRIVKWKDRWMSVGKIVGEELKNKFM